MEHEVNSVNQKITKASVVPLKSVSSIWLIPLIALLIGLWMVIDSWRQQGPTITLEFDTAEGIEVNQSLIKLRDISVGKIVAMKLNDKMNRVILTVHMKSNTEKLLSKDSLFWVVKPHISMGNVSGLSTLLSGSYIELSPGKSEETASHFVGLETPPLTPADTPGLHLTLDSNSDHAFEIGDPILFRGNKAGRIEFVHFNSDERKTYYNVFIDAPYDKLITTNTRFWEMRGIDVNLSAEGVKINTGTLETILNGGLAFDVPSYLSKGEPITERAYFSIYPSKEKVNEQMFNIAQQYILLFNQSIRGLTPGASVEYKGIKIGEVTRVDIDYPEIHHFLAKNSWVPIMIEISPGRMGLQDNEAGLNSLQLQMLDSIKQGLHAVLESNNLLTGSKYIKLTYFPVENNYNEVFGDLSVIPTADGELNQLFSRVNQIAKKIEQLPLDQFINTASQSLLEMNKAMKKFNVASENVSQFLQQTDIQASLVQINKTLASVEKLANNYSAGSKTNDQLNQLLMQLEQSVKLINPLLIKLNLQPSSLVLPADLPKEILPKGHSNEQ